MDTRRFTVPSGRMRRFARAATIAFLVGACLAIPLAAASTNIVVTPEQYRTYERFKARIASLDLPDTSVAGAITGAMTAALNDDAVAYEAELLRAERAFDALDPGTLAAIMAFFDGLHVAAGRPGLSVAHVCALDCLAGTAWYQCEPDELCCGYCSRGFPVIACCGWTPARPTTWGTLKILYRPGN